MKVYFLAGVDKLFKVRVLNELPPLMRRVDFAQSREKITVFDAVDFVRFGVLCLLLVPCWPE